MSTPTHSIETIGPEEAKAMLSLNTHNRTIKKTKVEEYSKAMKEGRWLFDGAPIRLDDEGVVLDGQHRLLAVVESGTTQNFSVWWGVPREAQNVMDTGAKRSISDALHLRGETQTAALGAILNVAIRWEQGLRGSYLFGRGTTVKQIPELLAYLDSHPSIRESVRPAYMVARRVPISASVMGLVHWVTTDIDSEDSEEFFAKLISGAELPVDSPIYSLRETLKREDRPGTRVAPEYQLALVFKAWNAWRDGKAVKLLTYKAGGAKPEPFPEPH